MKIEVTDDLKSGIEKLVSVIENEENAFSIQLTKWEDLPFPLKFPKDSFRGECGTPACIVGWLRHLELKGLVSKEEAEAICDADEEFGDDIFTPDLAHFNYFNNPEYFTRKKTVKVLKNLAETGELDWSL